jgi:hypothetical protein
MKCEFLIYHICDGRPTIAADELKDLEDARLFAEYLSVYSQLPQRYFCVVAAPRALQS